MADQQTTTSTLGWVERAARLGDDIRPTADETDRRGEFAHDAFGRLRREGFLGAPVPAELGGGGATHAETAAVLRALGQGCGSTAVMLSMHYHLTCTQVWRHRHGQPAEAMLRRVAAEDLMLISTGASDWVSANGTARKVDSGYRVSARKAPASGAPVGDVLVTSVRCEDVPDDPQVIHCSIPFSAEGVSIQPTWDAMGLRATGSDTVVLEDVFVPDAAVSLVRPADRWHPVWNAVLGTALPLIMAAYLGIADRAVDLALASAMARVDRPGTQGLVGRMLNRLASAEDAVDAMLRRADDLSFAPTDDIAASALTRKTIAAAAIQDVTSLALELSGGAGYSRSSPLERLHRDAMGATYHPLPTAQQEVFTARVALGLDPVGSATGQA